MAEYMNGLSETIEKLLNRDHALQTVALRRTYTGLLIDGLYIIKSSDPEYRDLRIMVRKDRDAKIQAMYDAGYLTDVLRRRMRRPSMTTKEHHYTVQEGAVYEPLGSNGVQIIGRAFGPDPRCKYLNLPRLRILDMFVEMDAEEDTSLPQVSGPGRCASVSGKDKPGDPLFIRSVSVSMPPPETISGLQKIAPGAPNYISIYERYGYHDVAANNPNRGYVDVFVTDIQMRNRSNFIKESISVDLLNRLFTYYPDAGILVDNHTHHEVATYSVRIKGVTHTKAVIIVYMYTGRKPRMVRFLNGDRNDFRWSNLVPVYNPAK